MSQHIKRFTPEQLAVTLGFPENTRVIGFRCVDWCQEWEIAADTSKKGTIPQFASVYYCAEDYEKAYRVFITETFKARDQDKQYPIQPVFRPADLEDTCREEEKCRYATSLQLTGETGK